MLAAAKKTPSLIIDCANCANPHVLSEFPIDILHKIYVIELELLYKFRDILKRVPSIARNLDIKCIFVTTSDHLFNYQDEEENKNIFLHAWELMSALGKYYPIIVGMTEKSLHLEYAKRFCNKLAVV